MNQPVWQLKKQMCDIGQRIWQRGFCAGNEGNHSIRIGENRVLCTPTGISKGFLTPDDICVVDMDGNQVERNPNGRRRTSEILVHLAIYKKRPDIKAVIHSHPPHATAFAICNMPLPEGIHPEAEVFLGRVPIAKFAMPSKPDLADSIIPLIKEDTNTVLMGNHGSVSFGKDLIDTYYKLEILDAYCRILLLAHPLKRVNTLTAEEMTGLLQVKQQFGIPDSRLACAPTGCVGEQNQEFFATFDVQPMSASCGCGCNGQGSTTTQLSDTPDGDPTFEAMVQTITDQIMATVGA